MPRLDTDRQKELEPKRMGYAKAEIEKLGYPVMITGSTSLQFTYKREIIRVFPYSGWCTGKTITDCRGIKKLLKQINK